MVIYENIIQKERESKSLSLGEGYLLNKNRYV